MCTAVLITVETKGGKKKPTHTKIQDFKAKSSTDWTNINFTESDPFFYVKANKKHEKKKTLKSLSHQKAQGESHSGSHTVIRQTVHQLP